MVRKWAGTTERRADLTSSLFLWMISLFWVRCLRLTGKERCEKSFNMVNRGYVQFSCASESMSVELRRVAIPPSSPLPVSRDIDGDKSCLFRNS